jgi:outer membrane protein assembly factor BamB
MKKILYLALAPFRLVGTPRCGVRSAQRADPTFQHHPKTNVLLALALALASSFCCAPARAADWPNFRGPTHNGISSETGWLAKWPAAGPKQLWKASVGLGYATITVANNRAYATGNAGDTATLYCFDAGTGATLWKFSCATKIVDDYSKPKGMGGASGSPAVDGDRVYLMSGEGCLFALEAGSGAIVWSNNLAAELGLVKPHWGFTGSPLVQDNLLVLDAGGSGTAVDKATGKVVWTSDKASSGYSTPVPCAFSGVPAVAILTADDACAVETKSGKLIWRFPFKSQINIADVVVSNNDFFMSAGYNKGAVLARFDGTKAAQVWANSSFANHINSSVLVDGCLYGVGGMVNGGAKSAPLRCVDFATGAQKWSYQEVGGGGLIVAGHKILMLGDTGELVVGEVSPEAFTPISRAKVLGEWCWTAPTLANGRVYCRNNQGDLVCLDVKVP